MSEYKKIPPNYDYMNTKIINFIEAAIIDALIVFILCKLELGFKANMYIGLFTMLPVTVFCIIGINDQSLSTGIYNYIRFLKRRRVLGKPSAEYIRAKDKAMLKKKKKEAKKK